MYEQLTKPSTGTQPVTDYKDGLKTRLRDAWHLAAERDVVAKVKGKTYFDKKAKSRRFEVGDKVLVMTPSMTGKLDDQWMGPYIIAEKMNDVIYKVHTPDRRKKSRLFHVNGIKSWHTEPVAIMSVRFCEEDQVRESQDPDVLPFEPKEAGTPTIGDLAREKSYSSYYKNTEQSLIPLPATQRWLNTGS